MVVLAVGALTAAGGAAAYAVYPERVRVFLGWQKQPRPRHRTEDGCDVPSVGAEAPVVRCFSGDRARCGESLRMAVFKDQLLLSRQPGPPEEAIPLSRADIVVQAAVIVVEPLDAPSLTLWLEDSEEAEYWDDVLRFAAQAAAAEELCLEDESRPNSKIQELENRVSSALRAAYERSARIKELEDTVEASREREQRIQQLEEVLHETLEEAEARAERIEALEWQLEANGVASDPAAAAILQDAMQFADQLLADKEELVMDDDSALQLREAVQAVQKAKPAVDAEVAELIRKLVTALRWPLVLRERLRDAEETVKEQEEIQEQALLEIIELQKTCDTLESEAALKKEADEAAAKQKALTEAAHADELSKLKERQEDAERQRQEAEAKAKELRELLDFADQAAEEAVARQKEELEKTHAEEIAKLRNLADMAAAQQADAVARAQEIQNQLLSAEASLNEKAELEKEMFSAKHHDEVMDLRRQFAVAEQQREQAEAQALNLTKRLEDISSDKEAELEKLRVALEDAQKKQAADLEAVTQRDHQEEGLRQELLDLKKNREATDKRRAEAEEQLNELRAMLSSAQGRTEASEAQHEQEIRSLQSRCETAEVKGQLAEANAQQLKERLIAQANGLDEKERERELEDVRQRHKDAETKQKAADARAEELRRRLEEAENAALLTKQQHVASPDTAKEDEIRSLRQQMEAAEERMNKVESQASQFREKLAAAESSLNQGAQRKRDMLDSQRERSLGHEPQTPEESSKHFAETAASQWRQAADQASEQLAGSDYAAPDQFADKKKELEQRLASAESALKNLQTPEPSPPTTPAKNRGRQKGRK